MLRPVLLTVFFVLTTALPSQAVAEEYDLNRIEHLAESAPTAVHEFVTRKLECFHWAGEEPYDKARRREIARAIKRLACLNLDRDETELRQRHGKDPNALAPLDEARTLLF